MGTPDYILASRQYIAERELELSLGNPTYHSGACTRDTSTATPKQIERRVIGKIRINRLTGKVLD